MTEIGYGLLFAGSQYTLIRDLFTLSWSLSYLLCIILFCVLGQRPQGGVSKERWFYATIFTPMYFAVLFFIPMLARPLTCLVAVTIGILVKIGVCMSVCLHRYAAHQAFRCGTIAAKRRGIGNSPKLGVHERAFGPSGRDGVRWLKGVDRQVQRRAAS